jgi:hypothetical protein
MFINREYYVALSVSHPVSTRDTNIIPKELFPYHIPYQPETPISSRELSSLGMILVSRVDMGCDTERAISYYVYHLYFLFIFIIYLVLNKGNLHTAYNTERTLRLYLSAVTDIDIIASLSYPLR